MEQVTRKQKGDDTLRGGRGYYGQLGRGEKDGNRQRQLGPEIDRCEGGETRYRRRHRCATLRLEVILPIYIYIYNYALKQSHLHTHIQ